MTRILSVKNKLFSLRGRTLITDDDGALRYLAKGKFTLLVPTSRLFKDDCEVASIRRQLLAWTPRWNVDGHLDEFVVRKKFFSLYRRYTISGGPLDGATVTGSLLDLKFNIDMDGNLISRAIGRLVSLHDTGTKWLWTYNNERPNMANGGFTPMQKLARAA